jgi:aspartyl-tRNA(Asn)/glutamyl-tRNA(Gln) amidotransferase subunit C
MVASLSKHDIMRAMTVAKKDIEYLAGLSRIELLDGEAESLTKEIDSILGYVGQVKEFSGDVEKDTPKLINVMRDDVVTNTSGQYSRKILENVPSREGDYIKVKKIL